MAQRRLTVPLDSDLYMWLTELTVRQQDRGVRGFGRKAMGKDRAIQRILEWAKELPAKAQDQIFDELVRSEPGESDTEGRGPSKKTKSRAAQPSS